MSSSGLFRSQSRQLLRGNRDSNDKRAPVALRIVPTLNFATVRPYDTVANAKSQPRTFAGLFRRVKRVKYMLRISDARTVVRNHHLHAIPAVLRANRNTSASPRFLHRIVSIIENIQE